MSAVRPEALKGWPPSWYVNGNEDGDLRCPAVGCGEVFRTEEEVILREVHFDESEDPDTRFHHAVLEAMQEELRCRKCQYIDPHHTKPLGDHDSRDYFRHEREVHKTEESSDIKESIGFMRENRFSRCDDYKHLYPTLFDYHVRNIQKHPEFPRFKKYLSDCGINTDSPPHVYLLEVAKRDRGSAPPDGLTEAQKKFFPVDRDEFLYSFPSSKARDGDGDVAMDGGVTDIREIFKAGFASGDF